MQNHNDAIRTSEDTSFRKIYLSLYWKGCVWEGVGDRTELQHIDPYSYGHNSVSFPFSCAAQPRASLRHVLIPASSLQLIFSPTGLTFLPPGLYNNFTPTLLPASVTISHSIQPLDIQGYILIFLDQMHMLFTQVHFLFWQPGRVGGQYTTHFQSVWVLCEMQTVSSRIWNRIAETTFSVKPFHKNCKNLRNL